MVVVQQPWARATPGGAKTGAAYIVFKPGEMHMMLVGLKQPLTEGQALPLTLQFERAGNIDVTIPIEKVGAMHREDMGTMMHDSDHMK